MIVINCALFVVLGSACCRLTVIVTGHAATAAACDVIEKDTEDVDAVAAATADEHFRTDPDGRD